jgi:hypothetical protein
LRKALTIEKGLTAEIIENQCDSHVIRKKTGENAIKERGGRLRVSPGRYLETAFSRTYIGSAVPDELFPEDLLRYNQRAVLP